MQALSRNKRAGTLRLPRFTALWKWLYPRQRYRLTSEGVAFVVVMGLVGLAAWHSGTNLLYLMFAMLIALFLVQGILVWLMLLGLDAKRIPPRHVSAKEEVLIPLVLRNHKRLLASSALRVVDYLARKQPLGSCFVLRVAGASESHASYRAVFPSRGRYLLQRLEVLTRYPFGLAQRTMICDTPDELLVYPEEVDVEHLLAELRIDLGEHPSPTKGTGGDFFGLREYRPGESVRHIHWRSSAKACKLMVSEHEKEESRKATIVLNNTVPLSESSDPALSPEFEKAVVFAASLARALSRRDYELRLLTATTDTGYGNGTRHLYRILARLAVVSLISQSRATRLVSQNPSSVLNLLYRSAAPASSHSPERNIDVRNWVISKRKLLPKDMAAR